METYQASFNKIRAGVGTEEDVANIQALIVANDCKTIMVRKQSEEIKMLKKAYDDHVNEINSLHKELETMHKLYDQVFNDRAKLMGEKDE